MFMLSKRNINTKVQKLQVKKVLNLSFKSSGTFNAFQFYFAKFNTIYTVLHQTAYVEAHYEKLTPGNRLPL